MYPGTLYRPDQPAFFISLNNRYVLRCCDGILVDGKSTGLSRFVYQSADKRDNYPGAIPTADTTWMTSNPKNPLAIGQIVNNGTSKYPPNVRYQELDFTTADCPLELQRYLPNIWYASDWHNDEGAFNSLRTVVLVATRDLGPDEELFSTYIE
ncbi:SET domain-containing protein 9 [Actinomortierella wolfii]|nr:SET domain-containing protein 9 [Actinomortierella wolfii]